MPATLEWPLKKENGPDRWAKFGQAPADEASRSIALVFRWLSLNFQPAPVAATSFPDDIIATTKPVADSIKGKPWGADPMSALITLGAPNALKFSKLAVGAANAIELTKALKDHEAHPGFLFLYSPQSRRFTALAYGGKKPDKKLFDPFKGQLGSRNHAELADHVFMAYGAAFQSFVLVKAEAGPPVEQPRTEAPADVVAGTQGGTTRQVAGEERETAEADGEEEGAQEGGVWDWDFDGGKQVKENHGRLFAITRKDKKAIQQLPTPADAMPRATLMAYDWLKAHFGSGLLDKKTPAATPFMDPKTFTLAVTDRSDANDGALAALKSGKATTDGFKLADAPTKANSGEFKKSNKDLIFKIDALPAGAYLLGFWGVVAPPAQVGHRIAFMKKDKTTGKIFDPNIGQCTVHPGDDVETLGEVIGTLLAEVELYKKHFLDAAAKPNTLIGTYRIATMTK